MFIRHGARVKEIIWVEVANLLRHEVDEITAGLGHRFLAHLLVERAALADRAKEALRKLTVAMEKLDIIKRTRESIRVLENCDVVQAEAPIHRLTLHGEASRNPVADGKTRKIHPLDRGFQQRIHDPRHINSCVAFSDDVDVGAALKPFWKRLRNERVNGVAIRLEHVRIAPWTARLRAAAWTSFGTERQTHWRRRVNRTHSCKRRPRPRVVLRCRDPRLGVRAVV
mmetsp:Transcript_9230/g.30466  ORF Transcript_9230/g.30466 Transcript_9230/m.30466 type:complete len:226 (+) Transcript_9230:608-1285(+)